jgi:hypothetical protein
MDSGHNNDSTMESSGTGSRRKFLQKSAAGVVISSIPAKSVWAGGGGILNSIAASTHASGWTGGGMSLLSFGCWKQSQASISAQFNFNTVFGGAPVDGAGQPVSSFTYGGGPPSSRPSVSGTAASFLQVMQASGSSLNRVNSQICAMYLNAYYGGSSSVAPVGDLNFPAVNTVTLSPFASLTAYATWLYTNAKTTAGFSTALSNLISDNHSNTCHFNESD